MTNRCFITNYCFNTITTWREGLENTRLNYYVYITKHFKEGNHRSLNQITLLWVSSLSRGSLQTVYCKNLTLYLTMKFCYWRWRLNLSIYFSFFHRKLSLLFILFSSVSPFLLSDVPSFLASCSDGGKGPHPPLQCRLQHWWPDSFWCRRERPLLLSWASSLFLVSTLFFLRFLSKFKAPF